jgi:AcrR family transcriptional regulator
MKNRRKSTGGYSRGDDTRARVIASALRLFGQHGFEGASTRDIAVDAGVNAPALQYYFANKEGLYLACVEHMVERLWSHVGDAATRVEELLAERAASGDVIDAYCTVQERLADFIFSSEGSSDWLLIIVREQTGLGGPDAAFQLMYKKVSAKLLRITFAVVGQLTGTPPTAEETRLRAITLNGQLLMCLFLRRTLLTALGWDTFRAGRVDRLKRIVRENTERLLNAAMNAGSPGKKKRKQ